MKRNDRAIATLNNLLADELTVISQYMLHSSMCANWGYEKLQAQLDQIGQVSLQNYLLGQIG